jgi:hypothetical protein
MAKNTYNFVEGFSIYTHGNQAEGQQLTGLLRSSHERLIRHRLSADSVSRQVVSPLVDLLGESGDHSQTSLVGELRVEVAPDRSPFLTILLTNALSEESVLSSVKSRTNRGSLLIYRTHTGQQSLPCSYSPVYSDLVADQIY